MRIWITLLGSPANNICSAWRRCEAYCEESVDWAVRRMQGATREINQGVVLIITILGTEWSSLERKREARRHHGPPKRNI